MRTLRWTHWFLVAVLALYAVVYARTSGFEYVWDDVATIKDSQQFDRPLRESIFVTQHGHISPDLVNQKGLVPTHESYRPFLFLTFKIDFELFGKSSGAMHVNNLIEGAIAILLAFALARRLAGPQVAAFVAAVFALHPLHVEPFAYVSARADVLSGLLALAAALCVVESAGGGRTRRALMTIAACVLFLLSLFTKEATIGLPIALGALGLAVGKLRAWRTPLIAMLGTIGVHMLLRRLAAAATSGGQGIPIAPPRDMLRAVLNLPGLTFEYFATTVAPIGMSIARPLDRAWAYAGGAVLALTLLCAAIPTLRTRVLRFDVVEGRLGVAGMAWAMVTIGPAAIGVVIYKTVADRYAFLPLFGIALTIGVILEMVVVEYRRAAVAVLGTWLLVMTAISGFLVRSWADDVTLYSHTLEHEPYSAVSHFGLGSVYAQRHRWSEAVSELEIATRLDDTNVLAFNNLGVCYMNVERYEDAERAFRKAIALLEGLNFRAWYNLGTVQRLRGDMPHACKSFAKAIAISPAYRRALEDSRQYCE